MASSFVKFFIGIAIFGCIVSCNQKEEYYKFDSISQNEWIKTKDICFSLDSASINSNRSYSISIEIMHNISYPYKNLYLYIDHTLQDSISLRDTLECVLVDNLGKWKGSGNGSTRQLSVLYNTNFRLDTALHNEICISHAMQDLKLKGIERIGLKIY